KLLDFPGISSISRNQETSRRHMPTALYEGAGGPVNLPGLLQQVIDHLIRSAYSRRKHIPACVTFSRLVPEPTKYLYLSPGKFRNLHPLKFHFKGLLGKGAPYPHKERKSMSCDVIRQLRRP